MHDIVGVTTFPKGPITPEHLEKFAHALEHHEKHLKYLRLKHSIKYLNRMKGDLKQEGYTYEKYEAAIRVLQDWQDSELDEIVTGFIPADKAIYFHSTELFGADVSNAFPSSVRDITDAFDCYAHGLNTACVFHLMRALEHPLRALAKKLGVTPPARNPRTPLDLRTWGDVIENYSSY